jgi:excisionase family DNA binding protein
MLYSKKEAAQILKVCMKTVERALAEGRLNCRRIGSVIRFTKDDLEQFIGGRIFADTEKPDTPESRGALPPEIIKTFENELSGISHGSVTLTVHLRDGRPRFVIGREQSFLEGAQEGEHEKRV